MPIRAALLVSATLAVSAAAQPLIVSDAVPVAQQGAFKGLPAAELRALETVRQQVRAREAGQSAATGLHLSSDADGGIRTLRVPTAKPGEFAINADLLERLGRKSEIERGESIARWRDLVGPRIVKNEAFQSTRPDANPSFGTLTGILQKEAKLNGWDKATPGMAATCTAKQDAFTKGIELLMQRDNANVHAEWQGQATREDWIAQVKGYESDCLAPVPLAGAAAARLPLDRLAVLTTRDGQPYCMALHLGGDRFVTARHCFYKDGKRVVGTDGALLSMLIDLDDRQKLIVPATDEPFPLLAADTVARDVLLIRVPSLSGAVKARRGQTDFTVSTAAKPALAIGYFPVALPETSLAKSATQPGTPPPWTAALRMTKDVGIGYCRVWDRNDPAADGSACIEHSCQTTGGFSGTPVFVNGGSESAPNWQVVGLNVSSGASKQRPNQCGAFRSSDLGVLYANGAVAAAVPKRLYATQIAATSIGDKP